MAFNKRRRTAAMLQNGHARIIEENVPELAGGEIVVEVHASLLSPGTELAAARQHRHQKQEDKSILRTFGYQNAGTVIAVGGSVERFKIGHRVACMGPGALHTDIAVVPQNLAVHLPDNVSFEEGAYCHLAATALHAIHRGKPCLGEHLLVVGAGLVGQLAGQLACLSGANVTMWDTLQRRLQIAREVGITQAVCVETDDLAATTAKYTDGMGFDLAVIAIGGDGSELLRKVHDSMHATPDGHREGRLVMVGGIVTNTQWAAALGNLDVLSSARSGPGYHDAEWEHGRREYPYPWVRWSTRQNLQLVIRLISESRLNVRALTLNRFVLDEIDDAINVHIDRPNDALGTILLMR